MCHIFDCFLPLFSFSLWNFHGLDGESTRLILIFLIFSVLFFSFCSGFFAFNFSDIFSILSNNLSFDCLNFFHF